MNDGMLFVTPYVTGAAYRGTAPGLCATNPAENDSMKHVTWIWQDMTLLHPKHGDGVSYPTLGSCIDRPEKCGLLARQMDEVQ
eukprot:CAMPEP_0184387358 /NCGR_PEP_ID=MMETSP0007-20130409/10660_1 /TAXON_ID=97485 /ORGANISM="Prymnesium parvum, Strain Texoma1" /LENGTH=82 /DNA_ID=CAMNT_0026735693 /DNA_START=206 /DNA_END=451 /DNA_ORIENTATION=+